MEGLDLGVLLGELVQDIQQIAGRTSQTIEPSGDQ
jgi:hypothetical protein